MTEFRPSRFQILPTVIKNLLIINGLVFLAMNVLPKPTVDNMMDTFALHSWQSPLFKPWQFVTHIFMHEGFDHILGNMFALWMFGSILENVWGPKRFLTFYMVCGLGAALCHMLVLHFENLNMLHQLNILSDDAPAQIEAFISKHANGLVGSIPISVEGATAVYQANVNEATLGASGAVFGCLAAFGYLFPNTYIYLYFFLPLKAKWFVLLYTLFELTMAVRSSAGDNIAHAAHLGGAVVGLAMVYFWNKKNKRTLY
jgi:membrane associated rhomboid family serine protease